MSTSDKFSPENFIQHQIENILKNNFLQLGNSSAELLLLSKQELLQPDESSLTQWVISIQIEEEENVRHENAFELATFKEEKVAELFKIKPVDGVGITIHGWRQIYGQHNNPFTTKIIWSSKTSDTLLIQVTDSSVYITLIQSGQY